MGYSQRAHVWYGFKVDSAPYKEWFEEIDYDMPEGVMLIGVDSEEVVFGIELFQSTDVRWEALMGEESFTIEDAKRKFNHWYMGIKDERLHRAYLDLVGSPSFHAFCNIT